ncbi:TRM9 [Sanghuangporus sanghuang]
MSTKAVIPTSASSDSPASYEETYVHTIYESIAHHFSSTRYKPWPVVAAFLASIPAGHIGLDAGCGNGKYLMAPQEREGVYWTIGLDRSVRLLDIAKLAGGRSRECVLADVLDNPWRNGAFDFAISIATIHHLSTRERRKNSIQNLLNCLSPSHGRGLIYVWSVRQDELSKRSIPSPVEKTNSEHRGQNVLVPWVMTNSFASQKLEKMQSRETEDSPAVFNRYYHLFEEGELRDLVIAAAQELDIDEGSPASEEGSSRCIQIRPKKYIEIIRDGWERSNCYVEFRLYQK